MVWHREKILFILFILVLAIGLLCSLFVLRSTIFDFNNNLKEQNQNKETQSVASSTQLEKITKITSITNEESPQENELITTFSFRMREKRLLQDEANIFPPSISFSGQWPENFLVINVLNYYYPNWYQYFFITTNTLYKSIQNNNIIVYQPLIKTIKKKLRTNFNLSDLVLLNIDKTNVGMSEHSANVLLEMIHNSQITKKEIEIYVEQIVSKNKVELVIRKLNDSIIWI